MAPVAKSLKMEADIELPLPPKKYESNFQLGRSMLSLTFYIRHYQKSQNGSSSQTFSDIKCGAIKNMALCRKFSKFWFRLL